MVDEAPSTTAGSHMSGTSPGPGRGRGGRRQGAQVRCAEPGLQHRDRRRLDRARLQPGRHPRPHRRGRRRPLADHRRARLRADAVRLDRLQRAQQGRPRLRDDLHLGHADLRAVGGLARGLGHHRVRRAGHGQPGAGDRPVRVPALQRQGDRPQPDERLGAPRRRPLHRAADLRLLPRHRAVGPDPADPSRRSRC